MVSNTVVVDLEVAVAFEVEAVVSVVLLVFVKNAVSVLNVVRNVVANTVLNAVVVDLLVEAVVNLLVSVSLDVAVSRLVSVA